jgi:dihydroorotate dehydrogenase (NAD+) catalytic subunit
MNARDALEYIIAGANAVQIGTGTFVDPGTAEKVLAGIKNYMKRNRIKKFSSLVDTLKTSN